MISNLESYCRSLIGNEAWDRFYKNHPDKERLNNILENPNTMTVKEIEGFVNLIDDPEVDYFTIVNNFITPKREPFREIEAQDLDLMRRSIRLQIEKISRVLGFIERRHGLEDKDIKVLIFFIDEFISDLKAKGLSGQQFVDRAQTIKNKLLSL